jgi:parallel beta-helix repeat protein
MRQRVGSLFVASCLALGTAVMITSTESADAGLLPPCPTVSSNTILFRSCAGPLNVVANNVTVNLGGRTVDCQGAGGDIRGINVYDHWNVVIRNGTVRNCDFGVVFDLGGNNRATSVKAVNNTYNGFWSHHSSGNRFVGNKASHNDAGITLGNDGNPEHSVVAFNALVGNHQWGIFVNSGDNTFVSNIAILNGNTDLFDNLSACDANVWSNNFFFTANQDCIH